MRLYAPPIKEKAGSERSFYRNRPSPVKHAETGAVSIRSEEKAEGSPSGPEVKVGRQRGSLQSTAAKTKVLGRLATEVSAAGAKRTLPLRLTLNYGRAPRCIPPKERKQRM